MESPWLSDRLDEALRSDSDFVARCPEIARDVMKSNLKLVTLVEKLGSVLTDVDPKIRSYGTEVLAEVLHYLPKDFLTEAELNFIAAFFVDRLIDHYSVTPAALKGIFFVIQMDQTPRDIALRFLRTMFQDHVQCQTLKPDDRRCVYNIFNFFIHNFTEDLLTLGPDFVYGFMNAIDQEKDARNLIIVFGMLPFFIKTFPLGHLKEEMFEIISCYFPVDYRPEYSKCPVSRQDLAESLEKCLIASSNFGEFCIPLLIEKLDSKLKLAKIDSFKVLIAGCEVFTVHDLKTYILDLWRIIQHEVLPGSDKDVRELGLSALKAIVKRMSEGAIENKDTRILTNVTSFVLNAGINFLSEVDLNLFLPAVHLMLTVAEASSASCLEVCKKVLPSLMKQYYKESGKEQKVIVLRAIINFVDVCEAQEISSVYSSDLNTVWQVLPSLFLGAAQFDNPEVQKEGFHGLAVSGKILDTNSRGIMYELLMKSIDEEVEETVRLEMLLCLKKISKIYANEVKNKIVEIKLKEINTTTGDNYMHLQLVLESLCIIADEEPFTSLIVPSILKLIIESSSLEKCNAGMKCLRKLLESCGKSKIYQYMYSQCEVVSGLFSWWLKGVAEVKSVIFDNEEVLCDTAKIVNIIIKNQEERIQMEVVNVILPEIVNTNYCNITNGFKILPVNNTSPWNHTVLIILLEALIGSLRRDISVPDLHKLVIDLVQLSIHSSHPLSQRSACRLLANLVNKAPDDENLLRLLEEVFEKLQAIIVQSTSCNLEKQNTVNIMVWITKSLVMRGHSEMHKWIENLITLLAKSIVGEVAAEGFSLIMKEDVEYMTLENFCNIRILYRQRFFTFSPMLIEAFHNAGPDFRINYLVALGYMLQGIPLEVLLMNLEQMVPLLVESLQQTEVTLLSTTLDTLHSVLKKSDGALEHNLQTFIPRILVLTRFKDSMRVRVKALQCIHQINIYPTTLILPFKKQVLKVLGECLNDHKRLVRKEAVQARSHWFLVGTSGRQHQ